MKNNIKIIIAFFLGAIIFGSAGVYATLTYNANQITYTKGNNTMYLSDAIDELYTSADSIESLENQISDLESDISAKNSTISSLNSQVTNLQKYTNITLKIKASANKASAAYGGMYVLSAGMGKYAKFKVQNLTCNSYVNTYELKAQKHVNGSMQAVDLNVNTNYITTEYNQIWLNITSKNTSQDANCTYEVVLFN